MSTCGLNPLPYTGNIGQATKVIGKTQKYLKIGLKREVTTVVTEVNYLHEIPSMH